MSECERRRMGHQTSSAMNEAACVKMMSRKKCEKRGGEEERASVRAGRKEGRKDAAKQARPFNHPRIIPSYFPPHPYNVSLKIESH